MNRICFHLKSTATHSIENGSVVDNLEGNINFFGSQHKVCVCCGTKWVTDN